MNQQNKEESFTFSDYSKIALQKISDTKSLYDHLGFSQPQFFEYNESYNPTQLASMPCCGDEYLRMLIEQVTGVRTNENTMVEYQLHTSINNDGSKLLTDFQDFLYYSGLVGQYETNHKVILSSTLYPFQKFTRPFKCDRLILLVRNPFDIFVYYFNYLIHGSVTILEEQEMEVYEKQWKEFVNYMLDRYYSFYQHWLEQSIPILIIRYEDLVENTNEQLERVTQYMFGKEVKGTYIDRSINHTLLHEPKHIFRLKTKMNDHLNLFSHQQMVEIMEQLEKFLINFGYISDKEQNLVVTMNFELTQSEWLVEHNQKAMSQVMKKQNLKLGSFANDNLKVKQQSFIFSASIADQLQNMKLKGGDKTFKQIGDQYDIIHEMTISKYQVEPTLISFLGDIKFKNVIDLGCGTGYFTRMLRERSMQTVVGVDVTGSILLKAMKVQTKKHIDYMLADCSKPMKIRERFDIVTAINLLEQACLKMEVEGIFKNSHNLLKQNGVLIGCTLNPDIQIKQFKAWEQFGYTYQVVSNVDTLKDGTRLKIILNHNSKIVQYEQYWWSKKTYEEAAHKAGFKDFKWIETIVDKQNLNDQKLKVLDQYQLCKFFQAIRTKK